MKTESMQDAAERYLRLARDFENAAKTYCEVRLYGLAADAESKKCVCESIARDHDQKTV